MTFKKALYKDFKNAFNPAPKTEMFYQRQNFRNWFNLINLSITRLRGRTTIVSLFIIDIDR